MKKIDYAKRFSESLEVIEEKSGLYRCPLGQEDFDVRDADSLTWDHYPPQKSIGGRDRDKVLVCKGCREKWDRIDAELVKLINREEFDQLYPGMIPVKLSIPDEPYVKGLTLRAAMGIQDNSDWTQVSIQGRSERNPKDATQRLDKFMKQVADEGKWDGLKQHVTSDPTLTYSERLVECSFLKAAYLAAFDCLGYPYILSPELSTIRQQMREPKVAHLTNHTLLFSPQPPGYDREILLAYMQSPEPLTGLAVFFLGYNLSRWCVTFLPLPGRSGLPEYGRLDQALYESGEMKFVGIERSQDLITSKELTLVDANGKEWL